MAAYNYWRSSKEFYIWTRRHQEKTDIGPGLGFSDPKANPNETLLPARSHLPNTDKKCHSLMTKHLNIRTYGAILTQTITNINVYVVCTCTGSGAVEDDISQLLPSSYIPLHIFFFETGSITEPGTHQVSK